MRKLVLLLTAMAALIVAAPASAATSASTAQATITQTGFAPRFGESSFSQVATVTSTAGGSWSYATKPMIETTYQAHWKTVTSPNAMVGVHPLVTLRVLAGKMRFSTRVVADRSFAGRLVRFQRRNSAGNWYTLMNVRLGSGSLAVFSARVPHGTSALRVYVSQGQTGQGYLDGRSRTGIYSRA